MTPVYMCGCMDEYMGKRSGSGLIVPQRGSARPLRDTSGNRDQNAQFCNRLGCNGRLSHVKGNSTRCSEKPRPSRSSFPNGKEIIGSSSKTRSGLTSARKPFRETQKTLLPQLEKDLSETSSIADEPEVQNLVSAEKITQTDFQSQLEDAESGKAALVEAGSSSVASKPRSGKIFSRRSIMTNQDSSMSLASKSISQGLRSSSNANRYGLRSLRCNSISNVILEGCPSSESDTSRKRNMVKKQNSEGESSFSVRGKKISGASSENRHLSHPTNGMSISDSQRARNQPTANGNGASVRNRKSMNDNHRGRSSNQVNRNSSLTREASIVISQVSQREVPINMNNPCSSHQFSGEASSSRSSTCSYPGSSCGDNVPPITPGMAELDISCLVNHDSVRRYHMNGIAEVLFALDRIEQDQELTYEQLLALETSLLFGGLNVYDQHRDMRLNIDDMSYEELLALEERMGTVSTALSEEELVNCLRISVHECTHLEESCGGDGDETKCSICQEEYVVGDEIGKLECQHGYHAACVTQWLRLKNWCPICKASVVAVSKPSAPSSASAS